MLQRYQIFDRTQLLKRIRLFQEAGLQFAIFVSKQNCQACLIPAYGTAFAELTKWSGVKHIGTYDRESDPTEVAKDVRKEAEWVFANQKNRVHYHRHPDGSARAYSVRRSTK